MNKPTNIAEGQPLREGFQLVEAAEPPTTPAPAPTKPELPPEVWPLVVKLKYKPINDPTRGTLHELSLRQPTGGDLNRVGIPLKMDENGRFVFDEPKMHAMIGALSGTLTPILDQIDPRDWQTIAWKLFRFFLPSSEAWE
jgi:hypothetical protein